MLIYGFPRSEIFNRAQKKTKLLYDLNFRIDETLKDYKTLVLHLKKPFDHKKMDLLCLNDKFCPNRDGWSFLQWAAHVSVFTHSLSSFLSSVRRQLTDATLLRRSLQLRFQYQGNFKSIEKITIHSFWRIPHFPIDIQSRQNYILLNLDSTKISHRWCWDIDSVHARIV